MVLKMLKNWKNSIYLSYMKYLLSTELYIVEPWERNVVHIVLALLFLVVWYFNYSIVMNYVKYFRTADVYVADM